MKDQKDLAELLRQALRLSAVSDKAENELHTAVQKWFNTIFVRSMKLSLAKEIYRAGAFEVFLNLLVHGGDGLRITVLTKLDKYNIEALRLSKSAALAHIEDLASENVIPVPRTNNAKGDAKAKKGKKTPEEKSLIQSSKY